MIIVPANLNKFFVALDTQFWTVYGNTPIWQQQVATLYPTSTRDWLMGWIGMLDKLRIWNGPRTVHAPAPQTYGATVQPFELTEEIDKFTLEDDIHGIYAPMISHMGEQSRKWPDQNIRDLVEGLGYYASTAVQTGTDQVSHWNTAHPVDFYDASKGTYVTDYGAAGTVINGVTVGGTLAINSWATVWQDMSSRKNESGERFGLQPDLTMVGTDNAFTGKVITQNATFAPAVLGGLGTGLVGTSGVALGANSPMVGAMDNPLRGQTDLFVNFDLFLAAAWYMLCTKRAIKPFGWVLRKAPTLTPRTNPEDPVVFDRHVFQYGVEARGVAVWSPPFLSSRSGV